MPRRYTLFFILCFVHGFAMNEYEPIMSITSVWPFVVAYSFMGILAGTQLGLGLMFVFSGLCGILKLTPSRFINYVGGMVVASGEVRWFFSSLLLVFGCLLVSPFVLPLPYNAGIFALLGVLCLTLCYTLFPELGKGQKGKLSRILIVLFSLVALGITLYDGQTPLKSMQQIFADINEYRPKEQEWQDRYDVNAPKVGDIAPDFSLLTVTDKNEFSLSDFIGEKPTVLFLGANTCPVFSAGMEDINRLYQKYQGRVNFVGVYVSEPHAINEWPLTRTNTLQFWEKWIDHPVAVDLEQATSYSQRHFAARRMSENLVDADIPILVDGMDNKVNNVWVGRPARLYLISKGGKVIYNPGKGPYSFNPKYLEPVLDNLL